MPMARAVKMTPGATLVFEDGVVARVQRVVGLDDAREASLNQRTASEPVHVPGIGLMAPLDTDSAAVLTEWARSKDTHSVTIKVGHVRTHIAGAWISQAEPDGSAFDLTIDAAQELPTKCVSHDERDATHQDEEGAPICEECYQAIVAMRDDA